MNIPLPNADERKEQITAILDRGLSVRKKESFLSVFFALSPRILFFGERDCILASVALALAAYGAAAIFLMLDVSFACFFLFFLSPVVYLLLHGMIALKETQENLRVIPSSCRYTPRHLTTMRMLWIGGLGVLFLLPASAAAAPAFGGFFRCFGLSLGALFAYAAFDLFCMMHFKRFLLRNFLPVTVWFLLFLFSVLFSFSRMNLGTAIFFMMIPEWAAAVFACGALTLFFVQLMNFYKNDKEEEFYAFG